MTTSVSVTSHPWELSFTTWGWTVLDLAAPPAGWHTALSLSPPVKKPKVHFIVHTHTNTCVCTCVCTVLFRKTAPLQRYLTWRSLGLCNSFLSSKWLMFLSVTFIFLLVTGFVYIINTSVKTRWYLKLKHMHLCVNSVYYGFQLFKFLYSVSCQLSCVSPPLFDLFNSEDAQFSTQCKWRLVFTSV